MKKMLTLPALLILLSVFPAGSATAMDMKGHNASGKNKFGDLIRESNIDGYMLSYYFMDLRDRGAQSHAAHTNGSGHAAKEMDKPHHLMLYIKDANHNPVLEGKIGFLIKGTSGNTQKAMGMFMSNGFGITADMKEKGVYTIVAKAIIGNKTVMDRFEYTVK